MNGATIATVCLGGPLEQRIEAAAAAGFTGIELFENDLLTSDLTPEQIRARCAVLGMRVEMFQPFRDLDSVVPEVFERNLRRAAGKFDMMSRLGTDTLLVVSGVGPDAVADPVLLGEQLARLGDLAQQRGFRVSFEALAWGRHINTWQSSWEAVRAADHPAVGLCIDSFHILARGDDPSGLATVPADKIFSVQLADAPLLDMGVLPWSRHHRVFPGEGELPVAEVVRAVTEAGFAGPLSLEVFNDVLRHSDPFPSAIAARAGLAAMVRPAPVANDWDDVPAIATLVARGRALLGSGDQVDHVVLPVEFEGRPSTVRQLRDQGLLSQPVAELPAEYGLLHWQPLVSADRSVRVVLASPLVRTGPFAAEHPVPAMVGISCRDLIGTAAGLRQAGVPLIEVSTNYYDDLACRAELPPALLQQIRSARVLYDLDHTGAFLHCSTPIDNSGTVVRWVQRIGRYDGYGEATLPIQLAALHRDSRSSVRRHTA